MKKWQLQEAKAKFSEVVREASLDGPQEIVLNGKTVVVILSKSQYEKLISPKTSLVELMDNSTLKGLNIDFERNNTSTQIINKNRVAKAIQIIKTLRKNVTLGPDLSIKDLI